MLDGDPSFKVFSTFNSLGPSHLLTAGFHLFSKRTIRGGMIRPVLNSCKLSTEESQLTLHIQGGHMRMAPAAGAKASFLSSQ